MWFVVIPWSKNVDHIAHNFDLFDFELSGEDMSRISFLDLNKRYCVRTNETLNQYATMSSEVWHEMQRNNMKKLLNK